ncbi:MAG: VOC family protein [Xanthomonadaceae bacterium]|jgi:predicted enzyme related to lactoylglutathione lyase|nr:VOC family protein [Xanthomonadaceae bacterium]
MLDSLFNILYVDSPAQSAKFYQQLLELDPIEASATFALFVLPSGNKLGLWSRHTVEPSATPPGGSELAFAVPDKATVEQLYASWSERGVTVLQPPQVMDFGYTFTATDPDGHRLRVFWMQCLRLT